MENWDLLVKNNYDKNKIANELNMDSDSKEFQEIIDAIILSKIKENNKGKKIEIQLQGWDKEEVLKASHLTTKRIENHYEFLEKILKVKEKEELINLCETSFYSIGTDNLFSFTKAYSKLNNIPDKIDDIYQIIFKKLELVKKYKYEKKLQKLRESRNNNTSNKKNKKQSKSISIYDDINSSNYYIFVKGIVKEYIDSDYINNSEFVKYYNEKNSDNNKYYLSVFILQHYIRLVYKYDHDLYMLYENKIKNIINNNYVEINNICNEIIYKINNGVLENEVKRKYDLLDYYLESKYDYNIIKYFLMNNNPTYYQILRRFMKKYKGNKPLYRLTIQSILDEKTIVNIQFDENNNPIPNSGRLITREEKENVFNYLVNHNIPLYEETYSLALKKYINDEIDLKSKVKVK